MEFVQFVYTWPTDKISVRRSPDNFPQIKALRPYIQHTSKSNKNQVKCLLRKAGMKLSGCVLREWERLLHFTPFYGRHAVTLALLQEVKCQLRGSYSLPLSGNAIEPLHLDISSQLHADPYLRWSSERISKYTPSNIFVILM